MLLSTTSQLKQIVEIVLGNWMLFTFSDMGTMMAADSMYDNLSFYQVNYIDYRNILKNVTANISKDYLIQKLTFTASDSTSQYNVEPIFESFEGKLAVKALNYYDMSGTVSVDVNIVNSKVDELYLPTIAAIKFKMMGVEMNNTVHFKNFKIDLLTKRRAQSKN